MYLILSSAAVGFVGMLFVILLSFWVLKQDPGTKEMQEISEAIREGAMAFLFREYRAIAIFVIIVGLLLGFAINKFTGIAFVIGAACSIAAGFIGMNIATRANCRTAQAAKKDFNSAMSVAFPGGAVM